MLFVGTAIYRILHFIDKKVIKYTKTYIIYKKFKWRTVYKDACMMWMHMCHRMIEVDPEEKHKHRKFYIFNKINYKFVQFLNFGPASCVSVTESSKGILYSLPGTRASGLLVQSGCGYLKEMYVVTLRLIHNNVHLKEKAQLKHWWLIHSYFT